MMRLALHAVVAACSLQTASALAARFGGRPPPPDLTKIYKDTVAAGNEPGSAAERPINKRKVVAVCGAGGEAGGSYLATCSAPRRPSRAASKRRAPLSAPRAAAERSTCVWLPVSFLPTPTSRSYRGATSGTTKS